LCLKPIIKQKSLYIALNRRKMAKVAQMVEIPLATVDRLMRKAGAKRVSEDAAQAIAEVIEERALVIAAAAVKLAEHAGRKTVRDVDIRLAAKRA
jgi:histone H3/H4